MVNLIQWNNNNRVQKTRVTMAMPDEEEKKKKTRHGTIT